MGSYASAAVRGTDWTTTDRCDGTLLTDNAGKIDTATNNGAVTSPTLSSGETSDYRCATGGLPPVSSSYCVAVEGFVQHTVLDGRPVTLYKYVAALATKSPAGEATELCVTTPSGQSTCTQYPLAPPDPAGFMSSTVGCYTGEAGDYQITYRLGGVTLGTPLVYHSPAASPVASTCEAWLGKPDPGSTTRGFERQREAGESVFAADLRPGGLRGRAAGAHWQGGYRAGSRRRVRRHKWGTWSAARRDQHLPVRAC